MCYISTPYHSQCGCYGKPMPMDGGCIRATSQPGLSGGCWDKVDMGIENVNSLCRKCDRKRTNSFDSGYVSDVDEADTRDSSPARTSQSTFLELPGPRADSKATTSSIRSASASGRSSADDARVLLSFLPKTVPTIKRNESGVSLASAISTSTRVLESQATVNLHRRAFSGRGYFENAEHWP